jgi:hypothetical protein
MSLRPLRFWTMLIALTVSALLLAGCPAIPFGDPVCGWRVTFSVYEDTDADGTRGSGEGPVYNVRFLITETRNGKTQWPRYLGADARGEAVYDHPGVGFCPDAVRVVAEAPAPFSPTTAREADLVPNTTTTVEWGFAVADGVVLPPPAGAAMSCHTAPVLRGAITGRLLAPDGDLWVTRIDKTQPVSLLRGGSESVLTIPGMTEARDPTLDAQGNLWVAGGVNGGVARYDGKAWRRFTIDDGLPADDAFTLELAGGALWTVTWEGPARFNSAEQRWETFPALKDTFRVFDPDNGDLWFADGATLLRTTATDPGTVLHRTDPGITENINAKDVMLRVNGESTEIWVGGEVRGESILARYVLEEDAWTNYSYNSTEGALPVADLWNLELLPDGSIFAGARHGGFRIIPGRPGDPTATTWVVFPDFKQQTESSAQVTTDNSLLISQLVPVNDASGYDRLCKVW